MVESYWYYFYADALFSFSLSFLMEHHFSCKLSLPNMCFRQNFAFFNLCLRYQFSRGPAGWVNEFTTAREQQGPMDDQWVNEFSKLHVQDWADEFGRQVGEGILGDDSWADTYDE